MCHTHQLARKEGSGDLAYGELHTYAWKVVIANKKLDGQMQKNPWPALHKRAGI